MIKYQFQRAHIEAYVWIIALISLAFIDPSASEHFTLCPLKNMGFNWCPGCGLGHSIAHLYHGEITASIHCHLLGIPALIILSYRIVQLLHGSIKKGQ